jgi:pimeloyl-ACP methyl ester carboxylesterase
MLGRPCGRRKEDMSSYTIKIGNDKYIAVNEIGKTDGFPIVVNHGMIASIADEYLFDSLVKNGYRVISFARPGYGSSTAFEMENIKEWGRIIEEILEKINVNKIDILGMSSGAPYSYAIAAVIPNKVRGIYIFSGTPALHNKNVRKLWPYPLNENVSIKELLRIAKELFFTNGIDQNDKGSIDSAKNECYGIALDLKIRCQDWGFDLREVKNEVYMEHGLNDTSIPYGTAEITAGLLGNCILHERKNGDHFSRELLEEFINNNIISNKYE